MGLEAMGEWGGAWKGRMVFGKGMGSGEGVN